MKQVLICGAAALCIFASCKSKDEKNLIGTWKITTQAIDSNKNGVMDASEKEDVSAGNLQYTFEKGGDVKVNTILGNLSGSWDLKNGGDVLAITFLGISQDMKVLELSNTDLKLEYTDDEGTKNWEEATKQ